MVGMCVNVARFAGRSLALQVFSRARWWLSLVNPNAWRIHCPPEASSVCSQRGGWGARAEMRARRWRAELVSTHGGGISGDTPAPDGFADLSRRVRWSWADYEVWLGELLPRGGRGRAQRLGRSCFGTKLRVIEAVFRIDSIQWNSD
jgi:hypothetical protein